MVRKSALGVARPQDLVERDFHMTRPYQLWVSDFTYVATWRGFVHVVEFATLAWVNWFNTRRLLEPIEYVPPAEYEARYYVQAAAA